MAFNFLKAEVREQKMLSWASIGLFIFMRRVKFTFALKSCLQMMTSIYIKCSSKQLSADN